MNVQLDAEDYGNQNKLNDAGEAVSYNWQNVNRYEGEQNEDKRLFAFEEPGDF
jgi:extradiol dioxygenase family protein